VPREVNILALIKGDERYVFVYDSASREQLIDLFREYAANPALSFSWLDAAVLTERVRRQGTSDWRTRRFLPTGDRFWAS